MVFRNKSLFGWLTCPTSCLVHQGSTEFFAERGRNRCRSQVFPTVDISIHPGDIRGRSLKLSEIVPNFVCFLASKIFKSMHVLKHSCSGT